MIFGNQVSILDNQAMLPSSAYDAFYVQHPSGQGSSSGHIHTPFSSMPMIDNRSDHGGGMSDGGIQHLLDQESLLDLDVHNDGMLDQQQQDLLPHQQSSQNNSYRQSPSTPNSHLPWIPSAPSTSKDIFPSNWNDYHDRLYQPSINDVISHAQLYSHYAAPLASPFDASIPYDHSPLTSTFIPPSSNFILDRYQPDTIGDDSGSGGTTRPRPKKRRKVTAKKEESSDSPLRLNELDEQSKMQLIATQAAAQQDLLDAAPSIFDDNATDSTMYHDANEMGLQQMGARGMDEEPLYVNPKQYARILKRREVRVYMEEKRKRTEEAIKTGKLDLKKMSRGKAMAKAIDEEERKVSEADPWAYSYLRASADSFDL